MPTITKISPQKNNKDRYNIYVDGSYSFPVSLNVLAEFNLKEGQQISAERKEKILKEELFDKLFDKTLGFINYKIRTQKEIEDRLYRYIYKELDDKENISQVHNMIMNKIEDMNLIDDKNYATSYIEGKKSKSKPPGKYKIRRFLLKKGVDKKIIDEVLQEYPEELELEGAKEFAEKKMRKLNSKTIKDKQKLYKYLYNKGYSAPVIKCVVDSYFKV